METCWRDAGEVMERCWIDAGEVMERFGEVLER